MNRRTDDGTTSLPHKAVAGVSKTRNLEERLVIVNHEQIKMNPLMDRKVVGAVIFGMVAMVAVVTSPQLLDVVWCGVFVVVTVVVV